MDKEARRLIKTYESLIREYKETIKVTRRAKRSTKNPHVKIQYQNAIRYNKQQITECKQTIMAIKITHKRSLLFWIVIFIICLGIAASVPAALVFLSVIPIIAVFFLGILELILLTKK